MLLSAVLIFSVRLLPILASLEDNRLPGDRYVVQVLQPGEEEIVNDVGLVFPGPRGFVATIFPEVDARGFHEAVFDTEADTKRTKRDPLGINSRGFHDDVFNQDFGLFHTVKRSVENDKLQSMGDEGDLNRQKRDLNSQLEINKAEESTISKRRPEMSSSGFHGDTFTGGFGDFYTMKKKESLKRVPEVEQPVNLKDLWSSDNGKVGEIPDHVLNILTYNRLGMVSYVLDGNMFAGGFGDISSLKKRKPEMGSSGFHGDTFTGGFGDFWTMKRSNDEISPSFVEKLEHKRRPEMDSSGFHGDTFHGGFGDFWTMKKRRPDMDSSGFHGDTFSNGFGDFWTMKKRRPEMDSSGFHGDTFNGGFGDFWTMKRGFTDDSTVADHQISKKRPEMGASGFHGDTFSNGFGDFWTMKKRRPEMSSAGFHGDTFSGGFGDFWPMKKRRPEMDSSGFHGDTFDGGFGDFWTMKKRRPDMDSSGFHGDTFSNGFGDFWTMKKRWTEAQPKSSEHSMRR